MDTDDLDAEYANDAWSPPFGGPETERDQIIEAHEPRQVGGGPKLECHRCETSWPCTPLREVGVGRELGRPANAPTLRQLLLGQIGRLQDENARLREVVEAVAQGEHGPSLEEWAQDALGGRS